MNSLSEFLSNVLMVMYALEAVFFVYINKKCLFEKLRAGKAVLLLLLSPPVANWAAFFLCAFAMDFFDETDQPVMYALLETLALVVFLLVFLFIYLRIIRGANRAVGIFLYLCSTMLVPGIVMVGLSVYPVIPLTITIALHAAFFIFAVRPLAEISKENKIVNPALFLTLPVSVFIYKQATLFLTMIIWGINDNALSAMLELAGTIKNTDDSLKELFRTVVLDLRSFLKLNPLYAEITDLFVMIVLLVAVSVIVRNMRYTIETQKAHDEVKTLAVEMMEALAHTIDAKDKYTIGHSMRVAKYSRMLAQKMALSAEECENVYYYGLLHDLGKIGVPNEIINSPTKLTDDEYAVIKTHPGIGFEILAEIHSRPDLMIGARWHHERYDGKGYPDGKKGEEIPLPARIIAVADSYDAMTSNRSYRSYMPQERVRAEIEKNMGTQFDPDIARHMLEIIDEDTEYQYHE